MKIVTPNVARGRIHKKLIAILVCSFIVLAASTYCAVSSIGKPGAYEQNFIDTPELEIVIPDAGKISLVFVPAGSFDMGYESLGSNVVYLLNLEGHSRNEGPVRRVTLTKDYYIARHKITCAQYCSFLNSVSQASEYIWMNSFSGIEQVGEEYHPRPGFDQCAANTVPCEGARQFCEWLSELTGHIIRLPTEAEWEYAARAPDGRRVPWGNYDFEIKWMDRVDANDPNSCLPVDAFPAIETPLGLFRVADFVGEWCSDRYAWRYDKSDTIDPKGPDYATGGRVSHSLRRSMPNLTEREPGETRGSSSGVYGFRIVVEVRDDETKPSGPMKSE